MHDAGHATGLPREADAVSAIAEAYLARPAVTPLPRCGAQ